MSKGIAGTEAVECVLTSTRGVGRYSSHLLSASIVHFYTKNKLWPKGITPEMDCIQDWAKRMGKGLQKLASRLFRWSAFGDWNLTQYCDDL